MRTRVVQILFWGVALASAAVMVRASALVDDPLTSMACGDSSVQAPPLERPPLEPQLSFTGDYIVQLFAHRAERRPTRHMTNVTMVTHITGDRAARVLRLCESWRGPMSVSVYLKTSDDDPWAALQEFRNMSCLRRHADLHYVIPTPNANVGLDMYAFYPFNVQRQTALDGTIGEWVFLIDVDFAMYPADTARERVFSANFHALRYKHRDVMGDSEYDREQAIVVIPATETVTEDVAHPKTLQALHEALSTHRVCAFYAHYCKPCHRPTQLRRYVTAGLRAAENNVSASPYRVVYDDGYEPYVVARRSVLPRYDERFVGRGWDKMAFFYELYAQRRHFVVAPPPMPFLVHTGRGDMPRKYTSEYMDRQRYNQQMYENFREAVRKRYGMHDGSTDNTKVGSVMRMQALVERTHVPRDEADITRDLQEEEQHVEQQGGVDSTQGGTQGCTCPPGASSPSSMPRRGLSSSSPSFVAPLNEEKDLANHVQAPGFESPAAWTVIAAPTMGEESGCVSAYRTNELDDAATEIVANALSYACQQIDCSPLHRGGMRQFPETLVAHADWAFDRYFRYATATLGESPETACHFNGAAKLIPCSRHCHQCAVPDGTPAERIGNALDWVCSDTELGDCGAIVAASAGARSDNWTLSERSAFLFSYHFMTRRCLHHDPQEACFFGGAGRLVGCDDG